MLDRDGVGKLVKMATAAGKAANPKLKVASARRSLCRCRARLRRRCAVCAGRLTAARGRWGCAASTAASRRRSSSSRRRCALAALVRSRRCAALSLLRLMPWPYSRRVSAWVTRRVWRRAGRRLRLVLALPRPHRPPRRRPGPARSPASAARTGLTATAAARALAAGGAQAEEVRRRTGRRRTAPERCGTGAGRAIVGWARGAAPGGEACAHRRPGAARRALLFLCVKKPSCLSVAFTSLQTGSDRPWAREPAWKRHLLAPDMSGATAATDETLLRDLGRDSKRLCSRACGLTATRDSHRRSSCPQAVSELLD